MKKLFWILLAVSILAAIALPAMAAESTIDLEIPTEVTAANFGGIVYKEEIYDENKELVGYGPEWTYYPWHHYCRVDVTLNGEQRSIVLDDLGLLVQEMGYGKELSGGIEDSQSAETPWEVGGTYDARYYILNLETAETVWEVNLKVTLTEPTADIQLSDINVDELTGYDRGYTDSDGNPYMYYEWYSYGTVDATIDGVQHKGISMHDLQILLSEQYGEVTMSNRFIYDDKEKDPSQDINPWQVGDSFKCRITFHNEKEYLFEDIVNINLCETNIASITAKPVTYYVYDGGAHIELITHYKDGTTGEWELGWDMKDEWPEEPGEYNLTIAVANNFEVPVKVTVLPAPTSGELGENVDWAYDAATGTLTISGTGDTYFTDVNMLEPSDAYGEWYMEWHGLLMYYLPKHVVVEEGITGLMPAMLINVPALETLSLPNSLEEIPFVLLGYNGPTADVDMGSGVESKGLTTFVVPQSMTAWEQKAFQVCWGIKDFYLPEGIQSVNLDNLIYVAWLRESVDLDTLETTIHFAGTEEQWNAIEFFVPDVESGRDEIMATGLTLEEGMEYLKSFKIVFEDPAESYIVEEPEEEEVIVENGTAIVPDSVVDVVEGEDIVIEIAPPVKDDNAGSDNNQGSGDSSEGGEAPAIPKVESVVIGSATVDKIVNANTNVQIKLPDVTVSFDKDAIGSIGEQAQNKDVTIVATEIKKEMLNEEQKVALKEKEVHAVLNLEAHAGEEKITEFGGGKVTISVPFTLPEGKTGDEYYVAYVSDDGTMTTMPTAYKDGVLSFETTHFSHYVVLEGTPITDNPPTGDNARVVLVALLMAVSAACLLICIPKRRAF